MTGPETNFAEAWSESEGARRARDGFSAAFGHEPAGVWAAPGRVNLIGEHTDYNGGLCLPIALPVRTYVAAEAACGDRAVLTSANVGPGRTWQASMADVAPGAQTGWGSYVVGVTWALRRRGFDAPAVRAHVASCVPLGAGLSSSAALEAASALASVDLAPGAPGAGMGREQLAAACVDAENLIAGAPTGGMDQAAALLSREGTALLVDCGAGSNQTVPFHPEADGVGVLVIDTRTKHALVASEYGDRRADCAQAAELLGVENLGQASPDDLPAAIRALGGPDSRLARRARHVITEIQRTRDFAECVRRGRWVEAGALIDASHASLRDDLEVSGPELDLAAVTAREAGALGARMTGGGFAGSVVALVRQPAVDDVAGAVTSAFASKGMAPPQFLRAPAAGPGRRVA